MAATMVRRLVLQVTATDGDAQLKLDAIKVKAEELRAMHPDLTPRINTAEAQAKMAVLRGELKATAVAATAEGDAMQAAGDKGAASAKKAADAQTASASKSEMAAKAWGATKMALLGVGAGLAYGIVKAASFQQEMLKLHTQAGVATSQLKTLSNGVLQLAGQVGTSPDSLAQSLYHVESNFSSLGIKAPAALNLVKVAAQGAKVGGADLVDVTNALTSVVASGIPGVKNFSQAMGALNATVGAGDMDMQQLSEAMATGLVPVVKGYGLTLNDVGAALATFGDLNIRGAHAGTQLRMAVQALAVPAAAGKKQLAALGMTTTQMAADMQHGGLLTALTDLQTHFKKAGVTAQTEGQVITTIFGKKAGVGVAVLMEQMDRLRSKYPLLTDGANKFGGAWKAQQETVQQKFADLKYGAQGLATQLGGSLLPAATKVLGWLSSFVTGLQKGSAGASTIAAVIGTVLAGIALKKLENGLKGAVDGFEGLWKAGSKSVTWMTGWGQEGPGAIGKVTSALRAAGSGLASAGSAVASFTAGTVRQLGRAAAATGAWIVKNTVATAEYIAQNVARAASATAAFVAENLATLGIVAGIALLVAGIIFLATHWKQVWSDVKKWALDAWHFIDNEVFHPIMRAVDAVISFFRSHWSLILNILIGPVGMAARFIIGHWNAIRSETGRLIGDVANFFSGLPGRILRALGNLGSLLFNAGKNIVQGLINGVTSMFGSVASAAGNLVASLGGKVLHVLGIGSPSKVAHYWGEMVARGLTNGITMNAHLPANAAAAMASRVAAGLGTGRAAALAGAGGYSGRLQIEWVGGGGADQAFITWLKRNIRIKGGDAGVLGR